VSDARFEHEGVREVTFKSPSLGGRADMTLFVPSLVREAASGEVPLVILLHGVYGSHWAWTRSGGAHRTAQRLIDAGDTSPMVLAMPSDGLWGDGSGYVGRFERFIVDEVPVCVGEVVTSVTDTSPRFIAGLSMGGFGALRLGAKFAERFRGISGHSSITHFSQMLQFVEETPEMPGPSPEGEQSVLHWMLARRADLPPIRFDCGRDDPLIEENRALHRSLDQHGIAHTYEEFDGGHEWPYWEKHLEDTLRFFGARCQ
jgi:S-formylglutathione hydrolase FrmB